MKYFFMVVRYMLTVMLLIIVARHSHWSVALCLTLICVAIESLSVLWAINNKLLNSVSDLVVSLTKREILKSKPKLELFGHEVKEF